MLKNSYPSEHHYYTRSDRERSEYRVQTCETDCFVFIFDGLRVNTLESTLTENNLRMKTSWSMITVDQDLNIYVDPNQSVGKRHHSTLVAGQPVLFAGMVRTLENGEVVDLTYKSGHYQTTAAHMKWFLDLIGAPQKFANAHIQLSDIIKAQNSASFLPYLKVSEFYKYFQSPTDTGEHVLMRYLFDKAAQEQDLGNLEAAVTQVFRFYHYPSVRKQVLTEISKNQDDFSDLSRRIILNFIEQHPDALNGVVKHLREAIKMYRLNGFSAEDMSYLKSLVHFVSNLPH